MDKDRFDFEADAARKILAIRRALENHEIKVAPHLKPLADEVLAAPLRINGLVDTTHLSSEAISFCRTSAIALQSFKSEKASTPEKNKQMNEIQYELFELFSRLFSALTGRAYKLVSNDEEIRLRILDRLKHTPEEMAKATNASLAALEEFYQQHTADLFRHAKALGGMKLLSGGQRTFGPSAFNAVRITGLYSDTQLIPDPIFPFLSSDLSLNAMHLQLAMNLHQILQLQALVNLELPVPPVFIFPSFEELLEENDGHTKYAMQAMALQLITPYCSGSIESLEELFQYARKHEDSFCQRVLSAGLFIPPGETPDARFDTRTTVKKYLDSLEGFRDSELLEVMKKANHGELILIGILERLKPQYHLLENAEELNAQPLLSQPVHWHYFEKCASFTANELRQEKVLSEQAFQTLQALQDDSLSWLANISIEQLGELIKNNEHAWLRAELNSYTQKLSSIDSSNINDMVREVAHGLNALIQKQQSAMREIEKKYKPAKNSAIFSMAAGGAIAGTAYFLPFLAPALASIGALGAIKTGAWAYGSAHIKERTEKHQLKQSMMGVLAVARK